ncbi:MAG: NADP-dependent malic enzyme [Candidatus Aenigmarchaeota archaeon]|nr:NADP-dependent malic enzyme [Candidatus Aenigmarchaeota archaeon]
MDEEEIKKKSLELHEKHRGKIAVKSKVPLGSREDLTIAYTPGVAEPSKRIFQNRDDVYRYTSKWNTVAVVTDGTAVLGLGDIGPEAALPVMEGKAILFKEFGDVDAFPICLGTKDAKEIIGIVKMLEPSFGGINLEDISAPRCFEIEQALKKQLGIPVFHDDQHGTAVVVLAGLMNALKVVGKRIEDVSISISGAGAAGIATAKILLDAKARDVIVCDSKGTIYQGRGGLNPFKGEIARHINKGRIKGGLEDALMGADVFIGLSRPNIVTGKMIASMNRNPIVFAMANPVPEIMPDEARKAGAAVIATGRSDFPNQINNVLAFPGIFRGALDCRASDINEEMKMAAARALAGLVEKPSAGNIIPDLFDPRVAKAVSEAVRKAAIRTGVARVKG